jgi:hypothetical protein
MMESLRDTLAVLLEADVGAADRDAVNGLLRQSRELRSWLDSFDVRCVRRTTELAAQGRSEPAESMGVDHGLSARESRLARLRAEACDLFLLFERALTRGEITAGHVDALAMAIRDRNDDQRFGLIDREERLLEAAMRMRVDDFVRHCRVQAADVAAELNRAAAAASSADQSGNAASGSGESVEAEPIGSTAPTPDPLVVEYLRQRDGSKVRRWRDVDSGMCMTLVALDPIRDAVLKRAFDAHLNGLRAEGATTGMTWRQVEVEAFMRTIAAGVRPTWPAARRVATGGTAVDLGDLREAASIDVSPRSTDAEYTVPEVCVVTTVDRLLDDCRSHRLCETSDGQPLAVASLRRLLCDALVYPTVLGGSGEVLDSGRARRTVNRKQRRALRATHRTCGHPGCTVPYESCRIHHVRWWTRDNGPSDLANLLPLCEAHHHLVHEGGWTITMTPDRIATWTRPDGTHWKTVNTADRAADVLEDGRRQADGFEFRYEFELAFGTAVR